MDATVELWRSVREQAQVWAEIPIVAEVSSALPKNAPLADKQLGQKTVAALLQELVAGYSDAMRNPLLLASIVPLLYEDHKKHSSSKVSEQTLGVWLTKMTFLERAHRVTVAWFRAHLAGYPFILAPQLAKGSPFTTLEFTNQLIWSPEERKLGLQFMSCPPKVPSIVKAQKIAKQIDESARAVCRALQETKEWNTFTSTNDALTDIDKTNLKESRNELSRVLSSGEVDSNTTKLAIDRSRYRADSTRRAVARLSGGARNYAEAFIQANDLINLCTDEVFAQLVMYGEPEMVAASCIDFRGGGSKRIDFEVHDYPVFDIIPGNIVRVDDPLVDDAIRVLRTNISFGNVDGISAIVGGSVLTGTSHAWRST
ncbi:hypothetical protein [Stackebrandtia nassauensis]|uniref:Uncharacterized protein n=1 Tax=Stackebrandtia nassauensis (strain DSM 44728 / CIP 108903 / NRRL B-16338 / NBRC 102104 / LLR-40K-21) TaxID=446470 RepID=D3Q4D7_STANL|nr:hypothetical protein [Stackebrandtia nassauensis]ADD40097.1 hypothetical protein Snas_0380 [Stackebrandtia nassauensis DSM 44728]